MFKCYKNDSIEEQIKRYNVVFGLLLASMALLVAVSIYDFIIGEPLSSSRAVLICTDLCILSLAIKRKKEAMKQSGEVSDNADME